MTVQTNPARAFVAGYDFGFLCEPFNSQNPAMCGGFDRTSEELRKFLELPTVSPGPIAVPCHHVFAAWRAFITETERYQDFCQAAYGCSFLHLRSSFGVNPLGTDALQNFFVGYLHHFSHVPNEWLQAIPVRFREELRVGQIPAQLAGTVWPGWPGWNN
jgi:hypothetical protein